ncbi:substrate-binding domain-containing protein [Ruegeria meonggei]|uniref:PBP superfamily domain protein n=1 Tax=Ruegeria meonggei TaxID=1446476 RepID=A0A1X6YR71_9RHOB|nr:substrate-binding domain-containing protein [Ruegeria meonggei]SLN28763.1 PBP superfamily domain protein [Ruegeria meonggei]
MIRNFVRVNLVALGLLVGPATAEESFIVVQSTTSTQNSGLLDYILPGFEAETGIDVRVVAVGTGQAIRNAVNGDGDVLLVHSKQAEDQFVADGWGVERFDVMYNDFVLVGPKSDPAKVKGSTDIVAALTAVWDTQTPFASRGDDSGTHKAEMQHWQATGIDPTNASGEWYRETGSGMGATLNVASGMDAYVMTDRATWLSFGNRGNLEVLVERDPRLFNQYGVILVSPEKHPGVRSAAGQRFIDWLTGPDGQTAIESYKLDGQQLFFPNAK